MQTKAIRVLCVGAFPRLAESQPGAEFRSVLRINLLQGLIHYVFFYLEQAGMSEGGTTHDIMVCGIHGGLNCSSVTYRSFETSLTEVNLSL